jgi:hypothetical protein
MDACVANTHDAEGNREIVLRATGLATRRGAWAAIGCMSVLIGSVVIESVAQANGAVFQWGLAFAIVSTVLIRFWPGPRYLREFHIGREVCWGKDFRGRRVECPTSSIELVTVEALFDLDRRAMEPWSVLHIRGGRTWLAVRWATAGAKDTFVGIMRRLPDA